MRGVIAPLEILATEGGAGIGMEETESMPGGRGWSLGMSVGFAEVAAGVVVTSSFLRAGTFSKPVEATLLMVADRMDAKMPRLPVADGPDEVVVRLFGSGRGKGRGGRTAGPTTGKPESESLPPDDFRLLFFRRSYFEEEDDDFFFRELSFSSSSLPKVEM